MDTVYIDQSIAAGQPITSENGAHTLILGPDGNLVFYSLGQPIWESNTEGRDTSRFLLQSDGNVVLLAPNDSPVWATGTEHKGGTRLVVQNDRNLVLYRDDGTPVWATGTDTDEELFKMVQFEAPADFLDKLYADPTYGPGMQGLICPPPVPGAVWVGCAAGPPTAAGVAIFVGVLIVVAVIVELANGDPPFGPSNDIRVIGGEISDRWKQAGRDLSRTTKEWGRKTSKYFKDRLKKPKPPKLPW